MLESVCLSCTEQILGAEDSLGCWCLLSAESFLFFPLPLYHSHIGLFLWKQRGILQTEYAHLIGLVSHKFSPSQQKRDDHLYWLDHLILKCFILFYVMFHLLEIWVIFLHDIFTLFPITTIFAVYTFHLMLSSPKKVSHFTIPPYWASQFVCKDLFAKISNFMKIS